MSQDLSQLERVRRTELLSEAGFGCCAREKFLLHEQSVPGLVTADAPPFKDYHVVAHRPRR